jgi:hypothetical protein
MTVTKNLIFCSVCYGAIHQKIGEIDFNVMMGKLIVAKKRKNVVMNFFQLVRMRKLIINKSLKLNS